MRRWFLPETPDVLGMLVEQATMTVRGLEAFESWSRHDGDAAYAQVVRDAEHDADAIRRTLSGAIRRAFTTPIEPEDLYELSERLDAVLNGAKNVVREAEVMGMGPDEPLGAMAAEVAEGGRHLAAAFAALHADPDRATAEADAAIAKQRNVERLYRNAMSGLIHEENVRELMGRRELYRRYARLSEGVVHVAHRVWYATVKER